MTRVTVIIVLIMLLSPTTHANAVRAADAAPFRYVDPAQAAVPWPYYSPARQPWRSYLEAPPASVYLQGLGVVWGSSVPGKSDAEVASELAWGGFHRVRIEFPWSTLRWDETGADAQFAARLASVLKALKANGLRPLILLNANHFAPCPLHSSEWRLAAPAQAGSREIRLRGAVGGIVPMFSMVATLAAGGHPGPLVTAVSAGDGALTLSKPLSRDLAVNSPVLISQLKYQPLFPVGTPQFENTARGWLSYVDYVIRFVTAAYGVDFDLEMWNELSFGSDFLNINFYFEPPLTAVSADLLKRGGAAWELAHRTAAEVAHLAPRTRLIWGFSNTTFFHTAVRELPDGFAGQSYHPYGVMPRCYAKMMAGREEYNADGFVPSGCATMPEGWAQTFQQTESLIRLLNPAARYDHPGGVDHFEHYITEHGFSPAELGIHDVQTALHAKEKFLVRASLFWLNKGLSGLFIFNSFDPDDERFGVLLGSGGISPALQALHRVVSRLGAGEQTVVPAPLDASVRQLTGRSAVYANDPDARYVARRQLVTLLPFTVSPRKLVVAAYVMTEDFPRDLQPQLYRVKLDGTGFSHARATYYDPLRDTSATLEVVERSDDHLSVDLELTDSPRLLEIDR